MKMFSKDGVEMVDVRAVDRDGDRLLLKTKLMGSMSATIVLRPQDLWEALRLLSWPLLLRLPGMLYRGRQQARAAQTTKVAKA